ncbi:receptor-type guanylate cyclase gcy-7-like isoform X2 [Bolinopsis microptera]|uniref:receptor-type guanylate cyclase gcy-7-like isoform X2 n=1 Tax=Bolinopsis microptera TaxID=2820187 RepID=UPI00307AB96F
MSFVAVALVLFPGCVLGKDVSVFLGHSPYDWMDTNTILYNYKGFFQPMIDLVKNETETHWDGDLNVVFKTADLSKDSLTRSLRTWDTLSKIFDMNKKDELQGIIGVSTSAEGAFGSEMCNVPYIHTYNDNGRDLLLEKEGKDKINTFSTTIRLGPTTSFIANGVLDFLYSIDHRGNNRKVELKIFHENSFGSEKIADRIRTTIRDVESDSPFSSWEVHLSSYELDVFSGATTDKNYLFREKMSKLDFFDTTCADALTQTRAVIVIGSVGFIRNTAISMYRAAAASDKFSFEDYLIIGIPATLWPRPSYKAEDILKIHDNFVKSSDDETAKLAFRNMFVFTDVFNETRYDELSEKVKDNFYGDKLKSKHKWTPNRPVPTWSGYTHDAALLLMKAIKEKKYPSHFYDYLIDHETWTEADFEGIQPFSGNIKFNKYGDRETTLDVSHFGINNTWYLVGQVQPVQYNGKVETVKGYVASVELKDIEWPNGKKIPELRPKCGYEGCKGLSEGTKNIIYIISIVIGSVVVVMGVAACVYRSYKKEQDLKDLSWRVDFKELHDVNTHVYTNFNEDETQTESSGTSTVTDLKAVTAAKTVSLDSIQISNGQRKMFKNLHVFNKPLVSEIFANVFHDIDLMKELKYLKDLNSDYLVNVVGLCQDPLSNYFWLVNEDCLKGTLMDVLNDETMEIDSTLKLSMIDDIATGMSFIHNKTNIGSHGNLKTTNILVSDNFTMKIGDYGECVFMSDMKKLYHHSEVEHNKRLLWRAPELVRKKYIDVCGTKAGDTYSFAIIVHEIINTAGPFNLNSVENSETPNSIILKIKDTTLEQPFRPDFSGQTRNKPLRRISNMVKQNWWHENPENRDAFKKISTRLKRVDPKGSKKGNFLDRAVKRMEKFSDALAEKAADKESQMDAENKKVNELKEHFVPKILMNAGLDNFKPERLPDTSVAVIELAGLTNALQHGKSLQSVVDLETKFRSILDHLGHGTRFFFGQGQKARRMWVCSSVTESQRQNSNHLATIKVIQKLILKMEHEIEAANLKDVNVCIKAGMHTGTIHTGLLGNGEDMAPKFAFLGVCEMADTLCSLTQGSEILVSPEAHKAIQSDRPIRSEKERESNVPDNDIVLDWGAKQEYESGQVYEAYCLHVKKPSKSLKKVTASLQKVTASPSYSKKEEAFGSSHRAAPSYSKEQEASAPSHRAAPSYSKEQEAFGPSHRAAPSYSKEQEASAPSHRAAPSYSKEQEAFVPSHSAAPSYSKEQEAFGPSHSAAPSYSKEQEAFGPSHSAAPSYSKEQEAFGTSHSAAPSYSKEQEASVPSDSAAPSCPDEQEASAPSDSAAPSCPDKQEKS